MVGIDGDGVGGAHDDLGGGDGRSDFFDCVAGGFEVGGSGDDFDEAFVDVDVLGAAVDGGEHDFVGVELLVDVDGDHAFLLEEPGDGARFGDAGAGAGERGADLGDGAVAVVGEGVD